MSDKFTDAEVIESLGGQSVVARELGIARQTVFYYSRQGIPWVQRFAIASLLKKFKLEVPPGFLDKKAHGKRLAQMKNKKLGIIRKARARK